MDIIANVYVLALAIVGIGSIIATVVLAFAVGPLWLLGILVIPGFWLLMLAFP